MKINHIFSIQKIMIEKAKVTFLAHLKFVIKGRIKKRNTFTGGGWTINSLILFLSLNAI